MGKSTVNGHGNGNITRKSQENMGRYWKNQLDIGDFSAMFDDQRVPPQSTG